MSSMNMSENGNSEQRSDIGGSNLRKGAAYDEDNGPEIPYRGAENDENVCGLNDNSNKKKH